MPIDLKSGRLIVLLAVILLQLTVPIAMIRAREATLDRGTAYRFQTAPVDPVDVFRGRYVALGFRQALAPVRDGEEIRRGQWVFARVEAGEDGFAMLSDVSASEPTEGDFLRVRARSAIHAKSSPGAEPSKLSLELPFTRFYMDEKKAPAADQAVWQLRTLPVEDRQDSYAIVRVHRGRSVLEDVVVGGVPIIEAAEKVLKEAAEQTE